MGVDLLRVLRRTTEWSCAIILALYFVFFVYRAIVAVLYPYPLQFIEGALYYQVVRFAKGGALYPSIHVGPPFLGPVYAPLYPVLMSLVYRVIGPGYVWGRLLSVVSAAVCIGLLARLVWEQTGQVGLALLTTALLTGLGVVYKWSVFYRVDPLAIAFGLAGFGLVHRSARPARVVLAAVLFAAAFYTKQSFAAAPIAAGLFFITEPALKLKDRIRLGGVLWGVWLAIVGALFVWLNWVSDGEYFLHTVVYKRQPWQWERWRGYLGDLSQVYWPLLAVSLLVAWQARRDSRVRAWALFGGASAVGMLFMIGLVGADSNYYLEPLMIGAALYGIALGRAWQRRNLRLALFALLLVQLALVRHVPQWTDFAVTPTADVRQWDEKIASRIQSEQGPVLADDVGWVLAGNGQPVVDDPMLFADLGRQQMWDDRPLARLLEERQIAAIITYADFARDNCYSNDMMYSPRVCAAVRSHYCLAETIGRLNVYQADDSSGCK